MSALNPTARERAFEEAGIGFVGSIDKTKNMKMVSSVGAKGEEITLEWAVTANNATGPQGEVEFSTPVESQFVGKLRRQGIPLIIK